MRRYQRLCPVPIGMHVDHANGDHSDDRPENLRPATFEENMQNRRGWSSSGYKGVTRPVGRSKFLARIWAFKQRYHLGSFDTAEEAALAYDYAALRLHRTFARLNFREAEYVSAA